MAIKKQLKIVTRTLHKRLMELNINHEPADDQARLKNNLIRIKCYVNHAHCALICSCLFQALYAIDSAYSLKTNSEPIATTLNAFWAELIEYVYQEHTIDDQFDVMVCEPEQLKLETFCDKLNKVIGC